MSLKRKLIRYFCMGRHRSSVPTGLVPLSDLHSVVMYLNSPEDLQEPQKITIGKFFKQHGMELSFLHADDEELRSDSDLFISLAPKSDVNECYAAGCSSARFKIGRHQIKGDIYDFVVTDGTPEPAAAIDSYNVIEQFLLNIQ